MVVGRLAPTCACCRSSAARTMRTCCAPSAARGSRSGPGTGGIRTAIGIGADAEIRQLLTRSLREMPMVGSLKIDWLGDWALLGMDDTATPAARESMRREATTTGASDRSLRELVELPIYAGVEVRNMTAAVAFLTGARASRGASRAGRDPMGARRAGSGTFRSWRCARARRAGRRRGTSRSTTRFARARSCYRSASRRCATGSTIASTAAAAQPVPRRAREGPQWILDMDMRERGPLWWRLALLAASDRSTTAERWALTAAEAVLRGAPGASPSVRAPARPRHAGRDPGDARRATPTARRRRVARSVAGRPRRDGDRLGIADLLASEESPFVRLGRLIARAHSEVAFDDEPKVARWRRATSAQPAREAPPRRGSPLASRAKRGSAATPD